MRRILAAGLLATAVALLSIAATPASAEAPDATGWWSRTQTGPILPMDVPSTVPEGGLYVAGDPSGPFAISALRVHVGDRAVDELVLVLDSAQGAVSIRACPTVVVWPAEQGGPLSSAPEGDCTAASVTAPDEEGTVRLAVGELVRDGMLNLVLDPEPGTVFRATFAAPDENAVATRGPLTPPSSEAFDEPFTPPASSGSASSGTFAAPAPRPTFPAPGPAFDTPRPAVEPPAGGSSSGAVGGTEAERAAGRAPAALIRDESPRTRVIAALVLFDLAIAYLWLTGRANALLGRLWPGAAPTVSADEPAMGIGRFSRPRSGPVPRL